MKLAGVNSFTFSLTDSELEAALIEYLNSRGYSLPLGELSICCHSAWFRSQIKTDIAAEITVTTVTKETKGINTEA